jgi:hypothetical protein
MLYLTVFVIPMGFVLVLGILLALFLDLSLAEWLMSLGWDTHVLAWGALGGVFSNQNIADSFGDHGKSGTAEIICVLILLLLAAANLALRRKRTTAAGWRSLTALAIGGFSLAVPVAVALHEHV